MKASLNKPKKAYVFKNLNEAFYSYYVVWFPFRVVYLLGLCLLANLLNKSNQTSCIS